MKGGEKLTLVKRIKICFAVLTYRSGHKHGAQVKGLDLFIAGYEAGVKDGKWVAKNGN